MIEAAKRVACLSLGSLAATMSRSKVDASIQKVISRIYRADLIVIDGIGTLPIAQDGAEAFDRGVDAAYEKRSPAVTSNLHRAGFYTIVPKALATPAVDRLLHHAHLINTDVSSRRLAKAAAGKGG